MNLTDTYRIHHPNTKHIFFSSQHVTFSKIDNTLGHKARLNRYKKIASYQTTMSSCTPTNTETRECLNTRGN